MENSYSRILRSLHDVPKVEGSFVLAESGTVLASDMPRFVDDATLRAVGERVLALQATTSQNGNTCRSFELQYGEHILHGRRFDTGMLCVLAEPEAAGAGLHMALAIICRRFNSLR